MSQLYHIDNLCPRTDIEMARCGFCIHLWPEWKEATARRALTMEQVNTAVLKMGNVWLDGCGFNQMYDPDKDPMAEWEEKHLGKRPKLGPNARRLYEAGNSLRVQWGEWGPEHITVPGNACGLDIDRGIMCPPRGKTLVPHNVDSINQAHLLLVVFLWFAGDLILNERIK